MKKKIIVTIFLSLFIAFFSFYFFQLFAQNQLDFYVLQDKFYSTPLISESKIIFLIGSSEVGILNATYIDNQISNEIDTLTYNLAIPSDVPTMRLQNIDDLIALQPDLIVYGIGYRDFANKFTLIDTSLDAQTTLFPSPSSFFQQNLQNLGNFLEFHSPKFITLQMINSFLKNHNNSSEEFIILENTPFVKNPISIMKIKNSTELEKNLLEKIDLGVFSPPSLNQEIQALEKIILKFKQHDIPIVLFTTPHANIFYNHVSNHNEQIFESTIDLISEKYSIHIIKLHKKYSNMSIWNDYHHVSINSTTIYDDDIALSIIEELNS